MNGVCGPGEKDDGSVPSDSGARASWWQLVIVVVPLFGDDEVTLTVERARKCHSQLGILISNAYGG